MAAQRGVGGGCSASHGSGHSSNINTYGGYASYLPKSTLDQKNDVRLTGTVSKPALTSEGDGGRGPDPEVVGAHDRQWPGGSR